MMSEKEAYSVVSMHIFFASHKEREYAPVVIMANSEEEAMAAAQKWFRCEQDESVRIEALVPTVEENVFRIGRA